MKIETTDLSGTLLHPIAYPTLPMFQHLRSYFPKDGVTLPEIISTFGSNSSSAEGQQGNLGSSKLNKLRSEISKHFGSVLNNASGASNVAPSTHPNTTAEYSTFNLDCGLILAKKYEAEWNHIKARNSENARLASAADNLITEVRSKCEEHYNSCEQFKRELNHLSGVKEVVEEVKGTIVNLKRKAEWIDSKFSQLLEQAEENEFKEWKAAKIREFETYKNEQKARYADKKAAMEVQLEKTLRDNMSRKRTAYQRNFEHQMEMYRKNSEMSFNSTTSRTSSIASVPNLESLVIEDNQDELNDFLGDISDEENTAIDHTASPSKEEETNLLVIPDEDYVDDDF
ncbi:hypothetical protein K493DRAFT_342094 [Basidiobolus meristosporus CBS 931.73]|uniref:Uncharacterized protein n=1 Tax=Basidiobolus meristosporus CBS 931.73 TaxID=1314790 RepID=A0A1Y1XBA7_9FUNG|nr:hypothetical protein K493DRAFT_342094 [Basidiobolus meristosporus CBS 931.73]|eukprot:ORX83013.1 hypothetical protein K493DRAFT_342094 [Basidiobolus meristosporus CBS 931.73]